MDTVPKVVARIKSGLGNQLFCYAAARRLALVNEVELVIDDVTGFARDGRYGRTYQLNHFQIPARRATAAERLEPFERCRRAMMKWTSRLRPFARRGYLEQESHAFDSRLLSVKTTRVIYLDGYWQSEQYFKDIEPILRRDLRICSPLDAQNHETAQAIRSVESVALHVRWFDAPRAGRGHNVTGDYYRRAIAFMESKLQSPHYFLFSDDPEAARSLLNLPSRCITPIVHNRGDANAYADLWLMSQCRHFITANSTFSWWGAWLADRRDKIVVTPDVHIDGITAWGFEGLIPETWERL